jgi:hypothetical protein
MRIRNWLLSISKAIRIRPNRRRRRGNLRRVLAAAALTPLLVASSYGDGTFAAHETYAAGGTPISVTTGDFNGDGVTDLATTNAFSDNVSVLLGVGDGTFAAPATYAVGDIPWYVLSFLKKEKSDIESLLLEEFATLQSGEIQCQQERENRENDVRQIEHSRVPKTASLASPVARSKIAFSKLAPNTLASSRSIVPSEDPNGC